MSSIHTVVLVTKIDRAAIDAEIASNGVAMIEPPQEEDCVLTAINGDYIFWTADMEFEEVED